MSWNVNLKIDVNLIVFMVAACVLIIFGIVSCVDYEIKKQNQLLENGYEEVMVANSYIRVWKKREEVK